MTVRLRQELGKLTGQLYRDHFHLLTTLSMAVDDCGYRLGPVDLGTDTIGCRVVEVFGLATIVIEWSTTEHGNLEAIFDFA